jgi:hypothetical protein
MSRTVHGIEYLTYRETAVKYGYSQNSLYTLISRGVIKSVKFPHDARKYLDVPQMEAYTGNSNSIQPIGETIINDTEEEKSVIKELFSTVDILKAKRMVDLFSRLYDVLKEKQDPFVLTGKGKTRVETLQSLFNEDDETFENMIAHAADRVLTSIENNTLDIEKLEKFMEDEREHAEDHEMLIISLIVAFPAIAKFLELLVNKVPTEVLKAVQEKSDTVEQQDIVTTKQENTPDDKGYQIA